jgi:hypothetical protein
MSASPYGYPHRQLSSGILWKFMPYMPGDERRRNSHHGYDGKHLEGVILLYRCGCAGRAGFHCTRNCVTALDSMRRMASNSPVL